MPRAKVLYLTFYRELREADHAILDAVGRNHDVSVYDPSKPMGAQFEGVDAVVDLGGLSTTREMLDTAKGVRLWQINTSGVEHFDVAYARSKGIPVAHTPGPCSGPALAETALMFILMLARGYKAAVGSTRYGKETLVERYELTDQNLVIIGFGASGQGLARRAKGLGMRIHAIDVRRPSQEILDEIEPAFVGTPDDLDDVLRDSDYVSLHLHVKPDTEHILDARRIGLMKPTTCIVNVARGALIDQDAMFKALLEGRLGGAGLDVFVDEPPDLDEPALQLPNVIRTPHIAGRSRETYLRRAACAAENVDRIAAGLEPLHRVDL